MSVPIRVWFDGSFLSRKKSLARSAVAADGQGALGPHGGVLAVESVTGLQVEVQVSSALDSYWVPRDARPAELPANIRRELDFLAEANIVLFVADADNPDRLEATTRRFDKLIEQLDIAAPDSSPTIVVLYPTRAARDLLEEKLRDAPSAGALVFEGLAPEGILGAVFQLLETDGSIS